MMLAGIASFTLAACNDQSSNDTSEQAPQQVEVEFDFDSKTKTVTVPPATLPTYRPPTTTKRATTTKPPAVATRPQVTR